MQEQKRNRIEDDEITLKELILKVQEFYVEVVRGWRLVVLITISIIGIMLYNAFTSPIIYPATLTFMINEDEGNSMGGISAVLGNIGLGGGGSGKNNLDKVLELARSRKIIQKVIFEKEKIGGKNDFLANHLIILYNFHEKWEDSELGLANFLFKHDSIAKFNRTENIALKSIYAKIIGKKNTAGLLKMSFSKETGIMRIDVDTESEDLSIKLSELVYEKLSDFYIEKTTEKQYETLKLIEAKVDSLKGLLNNKEYALASFKDMNLGLIGVRPKVREMQLQRDVKLINIVYGKSLENCRNRRFFPKKQNTFCATY